MSEAKTLFGLSFLFMLLLVLFGSMAIGSCTPDSIEPPTGVLEWAAFMPTFIGQMMSNCSGLTWVSLIILLPIGMAIAYLIAKVAAEVIPF